MARNRTRSVNRSGMASENVHKDVEYHVEDHIVCESLAEAGNAVLQNLMRNGRCKMDVVIFSEKGARFYGGDDGVAAYREDPEASVFERFEFKGHNLGRVP